MSKQQKIVTVTRHMSAGGAERVIAQLANYFVNHNIFCSIVTMDEGQVFYELNEKINLISVGKKSKNKLIDKIKRYSKLRKIIKKEKPDIVLAMPEEIGVYVILAMLGSGIPVYVSERNNPWVMPDQKITRFLRKLMYPFVKGLIFQTETAKSFFSASIQKKGIVLKNPVDMNRIPERYTGDREKVIVSAGRLEPQKNFKLLINSFKLFCEINDEYKLRIYGDGKQRAGLENQIKQLNLQDKVEMPGRRSNLLEEMRNAAMFVLPSDYEGMPNVLLEAMCMGMPVISTDCPSGGPKELIETGVNGFLVPVQNEKKMAEAMCIMTKKSEADRMSEQAYDIRNKYSGEAIFHEWMKYLFDNNIGGMG